MREVVPFDQRSAADGMDHSAGSEEGRQIQRANGHAIGCGPLVEWAHLVHALADLPPRVLVRTYARAPQHWDSQLSAYAPATVARLADAGVRLIGIDTASIDPADSKALPSHQQIRQRGLRVLENLVLDEVPEGDYELIALPLKLMTADASPVRAVLREL